MATLTPLCVSLFPPLLSRLIMLDFLRRFGREKPSDRTSIYQSNEGETAPSAIRLTIRRSKILLLVFSIFLINVDSLTADVWVAADNEIAKFASDGTRLDSVIGPFAFVTSQTLLLTKQMEVSGLQIRTLIKC